MSTATAVQPTSPALSAQQAQTLHQAVADLSAQQLIWSSGYLAGLAAGMPDRLSHSQTSNALADNTTTPLTSAGQAEQLTVLFGSQTGNGRALAEKLEQQTIAAGYSATLIDMADFSPRDISKLQRVAIVVSTHGEGDAPDDAELLLEYLQGDRVPALEQLSYTVLALGDSSYAQFCQTGRDFDERLEQLGANRFSQRVECDLDYEGPAGAWIQSTIQHVADNHPQVTGEPSPGATPVALQVVNNAISYTHENPLQAEVLLSQKITGDLSTKSVQHLEFDIQGSGLQYEPGDSLGVITKNPPVLVDEFLTVLGVDGQNLVELDKQTVTLHEALSVHLEITANSGTFLQRYAELLQDEELNNCLADAQSKRELLSDYQVIDVLHRWSPRSFLSGDENQVQEFVDTLRGLKPRVYSIASSMLATPDEVHVTVAEVAYEKFDRPHWGSASTALTRSVSAGDCLGVFIESNPRFRLPEDPKTDVIMIGPGTGVAPFRAFVAHRAATNASGRNWLFFGDRNFDEDFLYQTEWQKHLKQKNLHQLDVAFSRDQAEKIYVQDRLRDNGRELFEWLQGGASVYVCGDATHMAPDVHQALIDVIAQQGGYSAEEAGQYLKNLKREQRYLRDVY